jgi:hypothetical protein
MSGGVGGVETVCAGLFDCSEIVLTENARAFEFEDSRMLFETNERERDWDLEPPRILVHPHLPCCCWTLDTS